MSLFDDVPDQRVDARSLGEPRSIVITESDAIVRFEAGALVLSPDQWFYLRRHFSTSKGI